jgi:putative SOS response-associated peptidase YedK
MCGRVIQSSGPSRYGLVEGMDVRATRVHNYPPRWNAAPSQDLLVIRRNHQTGQVSLDPLRCGLIPYWCEDSKGGRKPINAKCETVVTLPTFRDAYRRRRCIVPVDGFFEWKAIKGQKAKQPYAIAMKHGSPFGVGGIWENWKEPATGEGYGRSRSSRPRRANWWPKSTTGCPSFLRRATTPDGWARSRTRAI